MRGQKPQITDNGYAALMLCGIILLVISAGCASSPAPNKTGPAPAVQAPSQAGSCQDKTCFITAANDCSPLEITVQDDTGTFRYSSSQKCVFTRTLVSLKARESPGVRTMLEGKNMTCIYTRGKFDPQLVTTLTGGMEYCQGELKDNLGRLMIFT
ncbi:hypothetical protein [uncultured Methanoregula sp.]|uniref:hypothetical protein n=1 Tax=uncultured Methanoregula sp. TaxID=1005933 RepID=UPI002AAB0547|nr:hypothetical protein [uncultured Methanoregula sp.]